MLTEEEKNRILSEVAFVAATGNLRFLKNEESKPPGKNKSDAN